MKTATLLAMSAVLLAAAALVRAAELQTTITANGAAREGNTVNPTNYTYTLSQNSIDTFTNFWFIATIPPGQFGNDTANANARMSIRTVAPSNRPRRQQYDNATAEDDGYLTNGQVVVTLEPRYNKLFVNTATNLKFRVKSAGDFATTAFVPYNASLFAKAPTLVPSESAGHFGHVGQWDGSTFTGTVPCCGAKWQIPINSYAHTGYYLAANVTVTNNTLYSASLWQPLTQVDDPTTAGARNRRLFDPAPTPEEMQPSLHVTTCDGYPNCWLYLQPYWLEVETPADSPYAATFQYTITLFPASNNPSVTAPNANRTASSSTGLNAATAHAPSTLIAAFTVLFAALLAVFTA